MIEINLLPGEFRYKEEKLNILPQALLYTVITVFGLFLILHLYLASSLLFVSLQYKAMYKKWSQFTSQRFRVDEWRKEFNISSQQTEQMNRFLTQRITISNKMQVLAQALPNGIWFNHLNLKEKGFVVVGKYLHLYVKAMQGKSFSRDRTELIEYMKANRDYKKDFTWSFRELREHLKSARINNRVKTELKKIIDKIEQKKVVSKKKMQEL